jgi:putative nucleotidyltransferase with HDIG domain
MDERHGSSSDPCRARSLIDAARVHERAGRTQDAAASYEAAVRACEEEGEASLLVETLRSLAIIRHRSGNDVEAYVLCRRAFDAASATGDPVLAAEALNTRASIDLTSGQIAAASEGYRQALALEFNSPKLRARIETNLGVIANIRGDLTAALGHYTRSLEAFQTAQDEAGCGMVYHNLGMISADMRRWEDAEHYYAQSLNIAVALGDEQHRAQCLLNRSEVLLARGAFTDARASAEAALELFNQLGGEKYKADAYRFLGVVYRETGSRALAEARFKAAIEIAQRIQVPLSEAEASRELAELYRTIGRNQDALRLLNASHRLFGRIDARVDLVDVSRKMADLEGVYMAVVRDWGQSIESADSYTFGHCERVAKYSVAVANALGLSDEDRTAIHLGAYLHDVGKVRIPHEILNKPGRLTKDEFEIMKLHTLYGIELLKEIEFPWDIKPIIRSHHEKYDGSGYPDGLRGDEIPLRAQVICVVDVFDAITTTRSYRGAMSWSKAMTEMQASKRFWDPAVYEAFMSAVPAMEQAAA